MKNSYNYLKLRLFFLVLQKRKVTIKKLINMVCCFWTCFRKYSRSGISPFIVSLELSNECNILCKFCRDEYGVIHDLNPEKPETGIPRGKMSLEMALDIIEQIKDYILICVLYTNGEPLMHPDLLKVIKFASGHRVATVIATNGLLLSERIAAEVLEAGIDLIKIQLTGFTQEIYNIETRVGDVEKLKDNIRKLSRINRGGRYKTVVLVDYILYKYNRHQLRIVRQFCDELGLMMNVRQGNPRGGLETSEEPLHKGSLPLQDSCPWLWYGTQVNWNGDILPCCEAVVWGDAKPYERFQLSNTRIKEVWNSSQAKEMRNTLSKKAGRASVPMCSKCLRTGVCFKW